MEQKQNELMKRDLDRFAQNLSRHDARKQNGLRSLATEKAEIEKLCELCSQMNSPSVSRTVSVTDLEQLKAEKARLSEVVKAQNLTPEEVIRMNTEHETLSRSIEDLKVKVAETNKLVMSLEVSLTNRVATAEEVIDQYNTLLSSPGLIPPNEEDLTIELNMASSDLQQLVRGPDMRKVIRPTLSKWAEMYRKEIDAAKREKIVVDDQHDHAVNKCDDLIQEIETEAAKVHALTEQAEEMREVLGLTPYYSTNTANHGATRRHSKKVP
jgi:kinetochore protein NDC80